MVTAVVPNADALIAERRASGQDRFDEVIKGVYFMVPPSIVSESNSGPHWRAKLERLAEWRLPVVVIDTDGVANRADLPAELMELFES